MHTENDDIEGKRKTEWTIDFFLSVLSYSLVRWWERVWVEWAHIKKWNQNDWVSFVQSFHCFGKSKIQMHVPAMRHELCYFSDSKYMLNDVIFAIKTGIV